KKIVFCGNRSAVAVCSSLMTSGVVWPREQRSSWSESLSAGRYYRDTGRRPSPLINRRDNHFHGDDIKANPTVAETHFLAECCGRSCRERTLCRHLLPARRMF